MEKVSICDIDSARVVTVQNSQVGSQKKNNVSNFKSPWLLKPLINDDLGTKALPTFSIFGMEKNDYIAEIHNSHHYIVLC